MKGLGVLLVLLTCVPKAQPESNSSVELYSAFEIDAEQTEGGCSIYAARLAAIELRLAAAENLVGQLRRQGAAHGAKLSTAVAKLITSENRVEKLERVNADRPQVAFSVGLTNSGNFGGFTSPTDLAFKKIFCNIGKAYNPATGVFTAPVNGAYHFRFTVAGRTSVGYTFIRMYKNEQTVILNQKYKNHGYYYDYLSSGMILELVAGDRVYMSLPAHYLFDDTNNHSIFTGVLVYPM